MLLAPQTDALSSFPGGLCCPSHAVPAPGAKGGLCLILSVPVPPFLRRLGLKWREMLGKRLSPAPGSLPQPFLRREADGRRSPTGSGGAAGRMAAALCSSSLPGGWRVGFKVGVTLVSSPDPAAPRVLPVRAALVPATVGMGGRGSLRVSAGTGAGTGRQVWGEAAPACAGAGGLVPPGRPPCPHALPRAELLPGGQWDAELGRVCSLPLEGTALSSFPSLGKRPQSRFCIPLPRRAVLGSLGGGWGAVGAVGGDGGAALTVSPRSLPAALHGAGEGEWHRGGQALPAAEAEGAALLRDGPPPSAGPRWGGGRAGWAQAGAASPLPRGWEMEPPPSRGGGNAGPWAPAP